jgi:hypothetical protein
MDRATGALWLLLLIAGTAALLAVIAEGRPTSKEPFQGIAGLSLTDLTTQALDSAPSTSEVKDLYKTLLVFADADIRRQGTQGLRILADFRDRVYGPRNFRADLTVDDFLADWPTWCTPLDTTIQEPVPDSATAATAEARLLAYLQKNWPAEPNVDEQTGSVVRGIIEDFGYRFVFDRAAGETVALRPDFLRVPLLRGWVNPASQAR